MEVEIKRIIHSPSGFDCDFCSSPARRVVKIGQVRNTGGSYFDLCDGTDCEEKALEAYDKGDIDRGE